MYEIVRPTRLKLARVALGIWWICATMPLRANIDDRRSAALTAATAWAMALAVVFIAIVIGRLVIALVAGR